MVTPCDTSNFDVSHHLNFQECWLFIIYNESKQKHKTMNTKYFSLIVLSSVVAGQAFAGEDPLLKTTAAQAQFPELPYPYDALEPYVDKMTMEIHYSKHHKAYYDNFLKATQGTEMEKMTIGDIFRQISKFPAAVRNNGGGFYNHVFFWQNMSPAGSSSISPAFEKILTARFGSMDEFRKQFGDAAKTRFGSGWAWLSVDDKGELFISSTPNQDNPLMDLADKKGTPVLGIDVWEHAYYLKYQNRRPDYVEAWWKVINWQVVEQRYKAAVKTTE